MDLRRTQHCHKRQQQRGISDVAVELLSKYGCTVRASKGASICYLDRSSRQEVHDELSFEIFRSIEHQLKCFLVVATDDPERIITTGHRYRRIRRDHCTRRAQRRSSFREGCK